MPAGDTPADLSLKSGAGCGEALRSKGYDVALVDADLEVADRLREVRAEVAFIGLHGRYGEDGCIQGLLESMGIPYTGSGVLASALGMDKVMSNLLFRDHGLSLAEYRVFPKERASTISVADLPFGLPAVVKPSHEGSSVGVQIVKEAAALQAACVEAARWKGDVIVEGFVKGKEIQVAVLDDQALGAIEVVPAREFCDQDDVAIIAGKLTYRSDDHGGSMATAAELVVDPDGTIWSSNQENDPDNIYPENKGVIERFSDVDFFSFDHAGGVLSLTITPAWEAFYASKRGANLDIEATLYDSSGNVLAVSDPVTDTNAGISVTATGTGRYYLTLTV